MMKIEVNTTTATLIPPRESLTPGAVNAVQLEFTFSDEWNGLTKTCVFSNEIETVPAELQNDITSVPTEVLDEVYRWISVGVSGEDAEGTVIIPTIWCRIGQCIPGASGRFVTIDMLQAYWSKQEIDLHTEGDGTKFLGDDGVYHYLSQGGGDVTHEELDAALALKADKDAFDALSATVDDKADKSEIITVTTGDGSKYLADDGTYKTITGGGDVTHEELDAAIAPLATKDEVSTAVEPLATKTELASATAGLATTAAMNAALALKADKTELASYAKQYDVNQALATKADKTETQTALAQKADKSEIITVTTGSGTLFLADDGTYKPAAGDPPDLSAYLTKTEAGTTYATKTELADKADSAAVTALDTRVTATEGAITALQTDKADASALADYETTAHAEATYATKAELPDTSDMLTKTEAASTYATQTELADKADKSEIITVTTGTGTLFLADDGTYKPAAGDPPDLSAYLTKTEASTTYETQANASATYATKTELADYETTAHAEATYATKTELADKADAATVDSALALKADKTELGDYETSAHASATYATKTELTEGLADKADNSAVTALSGVVTGHTAEITALQTGKADKSELPDVSDVLTKTEAASTYADKVSLLTVENTVDAQGTRITNLETSKADKTQIITVTTGTGTLFLADDGTYKPAAGDPPDLSAYLTKTEAGTTYATKTELADKADASALADYETTAHAEATYATKAELPDTSDMLTKTEAGTTYATKTELADYETTAHASATYATKAELPDTSDMLTKTEAGTTYATKTELADKADASALADYETTAHAAATYETKADASQVKSITAAGFAVTPDSAGDVNIGGTDVTRNTDSGSWGSEITYTISQMLPAGATSDTKGSSLSVVKRTENSGAIPRIKMTVDGVQLATSADIPDVSQFATTDYVQNTFESTQHASATYLKISDAAATYQTIADASPIKNAQQAAHNGYTPLTVRDGTISIGGLEVAWETLPSPSQNALLKGNRCNLGANQLFGFQWNYSNDKTTDFRFRQQIGSTTRPDIYLVTRDEFTDFAATTSPIKSITAGGTAVAPDANGNVALAKTSVTINTTGTNFYTDIDYTVTGSDTVGFRYQYLRDGTGKTSNLYLRTILKTNNPPSDVQNVRAVTYDEFSDFTATASPIKSITDGSIALTPDANGNVTVGRTIVNVVSNPTTPPSKTLSIKEQAPEGAAAGNGASFYFMPAYENGEISAVRLGLTEAGATNSDDVRIATYKELTAATTTFTHTYTGDAQDNWTVTDTWSGSDGELQKITWKEYAATAGSPGELMYTGTDSATGQKRSVRIATFSELGDYTSGFATMQWVQDYIASLDGTNMSL